jgi:class 3 adenylate cyclase
MGCAPSTAAANGGGSGVPREPPSSLASTQPAASIERNAGGCEEPHSGDPELWNIDGTEVDLNAKYKVGGQMWYLQSRATDAIKGGKPIAGTPFNGKARAAGRLFSDADGDSTDESPTATPLSGAAKDKGKADAGRRSEKATEYSGEKARRGSMFDNMLVQMLVERKVEAHEDTLEWACTRLKTLARLTPRRLVQHVVEQVRHNSMAGGTDSTGRAEVVSLNSYVNRTQCAGLFIDYTSLSKIPDETFRREGFQSMELLVERLNTYLGKIVDRLTTCGGDVIKFAGDAALVLFYATPESNLAYQVLKATQLSLECIADLEAGEAVVEGVALTAHTGIGVGRATGFLVGGVFNRSEYAVIGEPVFQIASAEPAAGNGETVISSEGWELIKDHAEGNPTKDNNWLVTGIKADSKLTDEALGTDGGVHAEIIALSKEEANLVASEIKQVVPGGVRNVLSEFTPTSIPRMSEFRLVTMLFARIQGLDYSHGDVELKKIQTIIRLIHETIYTHDGIFLRFSVDDKGAVVMGVYGLPPSHENDPERGVMASLDFSRQIHAREEEFGVTISVGLTTGYCWLGLVGGTSRCEYTTHAPMINLAARLMCATENDVLVDHATKEACMRTNLRAKFEGRPAIKAKGFDDPVKVYVPRLIATPRVAVKHWRKSAGVGPKRNDKGKA